MNLVILLFNVHLLPLSFRFFAQVHLLIEGTVDGQYITMLQYAMIACLIKFVLYPLANPLHVSIQLTHKYIHIYRERERQRETDRERDREEKESFLSVTVQNIMQ